MSHTNLKIGCAGAGVLGGAIMQRLLESRFDVMVWNRTPERLPALTALGAKMAAEPVELSHHADFILTCLTDPYITPIRAAVLTDRALFKR